MHRHIFKKEQRGEKEHSYGAPTFHEAMSWDVTYITLNPQFSITGKGPKGENGTQAASPSMTSPHVLTVGQVI